jgi:hypothetical protein
LHESLENRARDASHQPTELRIVSSCTGTRCAVPHEIVMLYRIPMAKRIRLPLAARPVNRPMSISALYCKAGGVRAAFMARSVRNYAKFGGLQTLQK